MPASRRLFKANSAARLKAVSGESFIIPPREVAPGLFDLIVGECRANGFAPRISQHARQMQTVVGLVASGMGVALVPSSVRNLKRPGVQYHALRGSTASVAPPPPLLRPREDDGTLAGHFAAVLREVARALPVGKAMP
ncbi:MAG: LysR family substrate-binding domain-containing protein [Pseudomonadota bacterium]